MAPNKTWVSSSRDGASAVTSKSALTFIIFSDINEEHEGTQLKQKVVSTSSVSLILAFFLCRHLLQFQLCKFLFLWRSGVFGFPR